MAKKSGKYELDYAQLAKDVQFSRKALDPSRRFRRNAVSRYAGAYWANNDDRVKPDPINLLNQFVSIVGRNLISRNPRVMLSTFDAESRPTVAAMQRWVNTQIPKTKFATTAQRVVIDFLFSVGITQVSLATPMDAARMAWKLEAGMPYYERIDLDDWFHDTRARDPEEFTYCGKLLRVPTDAAKDSKFFPGKSRAKIEPDDFMVNNSNGDERIAILGVGHGGGIGEEFEPHSYIAEVYLPRHRKMVWFTMDDLLEGSGEILHEAPFIGPAEGPYDMLASAWVPGNVMPKAPVMDLVDLHDNANKGIRKLFRQAANYKQFSAFQQGQEGDQARVNEVMDGGSVAVNSPEKMKLMDNGPPSQAIVATTEMFRKLFNDLAGGLEILGGIAPQSKTASQDKMLNENSSRMVKDLQDAVETHVAGSVRKLCWFWHHHPSLRMKSHFTLPGLSEFTVATPVEPEERHAIDFEDLDIRIDTYSLTGKTPQERAAFLTGLLNQMAPMMPLMQQQGLGPNLHYYLKKMAEYGDEPDLEEMFQIQEIPVQDGETGGGEAPGMPANTTREYIRHQGGSAQAEGMEFDNAVADQSGNWNGPAGGASAA